MKYPRYLKNKLLQAFKASPATLLVGPCQIGKITLMKEIAEELGMRYIRQYKATYDRRFPRL
jgi:hypothetical protein